MSRRKKYLYSVVIYATFVEDNRNRVVISRVSSTKIEFKFNQKIQLESTSNLNQVSCVCKRFGRFYEQVGNISR